MDKEEVLKSFKETYVNEKSKQKLLYLEKYYQENKDELVDCFIKSFKEICLKIKEMQSKKKKGKIAYITYSMLRTEILEKDHIYLIEAHNDTWFFDYRECTGKYDASLLFNYLDEFETDLQEIRKTYMNQINAVDIEKIKLQEATKYNEYVIEIARHAMKKASLLKEFEDLEKEDVVEIRVDEYRDLSEIVYKEDITEKDAEEIKRWFEEKLEKKYSYNIFKELNLSDGDYEGIDLRYCDFTKSNFQKSNMKDCILVGTKFENSELEEVDFTDSVIHASDFRNANLAKAIFYNVAGPKGLPDTIDFFSPGFSQVSFEGADLKGATFEGADLKGAIFRGANLENVNFENTNLEGAIFLKKDLDKLNLDEEQIKSIILES